jgi:hypothetical protein
MLLTTSLPADLKVIVYTLILRRGKLRFMDASVISVYHEGKMLRDCEIPAPATPGRQRQALK